MPGAAAVLAYFWPAHWPWGVWASIVTVIAGVYGFGRWSWRRVKRGATAIGDHVDERMTVVAARITDPIVDSIGHLHDSVTKRLDDHDRRIQRLEDHR